MALRRDAKLEKRAAALQAQAIIVDALGWSFVERPSAIIAGKDQIDRAVEAGLAASNQYLASYDVDDFNAAIHKFWRYYGLVEARPERALIVESVDDILRARAERKLGLILGFQSASPIGSDLAYLSIFKKLGLRIMGLAYDRRSLLGDGCQEPENRGLTALGINAIKEANRLGIVIDCTHSGIKTSIDAIKVSTKPVIFSHSNVRALTDHYRNLTDKQIDLIGHCNGVIGISTHSAFTRRKPGARPTLDDYMNHIDYVVQSIGINHVGIGTDMVCVETLSEKIQAATFANIVAPGFLTNFSGEDRFVEGFDSVEGFGNLIRGLLGRGYSDEDVLKILGCNWLRVFHEVWSQ